MGMGIGDLVLRRKDLFLRYFSRKGGGGDVRDEEEVKLRSRMSSSSFNGTWVKYGNIVGE